MSGIRDPFNKMTKKVNSNSNNKNNSNNNNNKIDTIRENAKKNLKNALNINEDKNENYKLNSENLSILLEEEIFKFVGNDSKCKNYRDKIRKIELRIRIADA